MAVLPGNPKCTMTCIWRLHYLFMACCWATEDTKPIERFMTKAKSAARLRSSRNRAARATELYTRSARIVI